ncbi:hypothetical protein [Flagellimonas sp. CMM7]|uniref:hypothetical protein n=1 Tax=Flagellimonas sp. CMM7 TaxID=2654676 RepID=UPI0013D4C6C5|nr:hypothetical protein [Flagellimonas sp. CMM7]UII78589.1 hypothetical protein LV704_13045 [Flagellimonas sp. CMM7]
MIPIDPDSFKIKVALKVHLDNLTPILFGKVHALEAGQLKEFLTDQRIIDILTDEPSHLETHHNQLLEFLNNYSRAEWETFFNYKRIVKRNRTDEQEELITKYQELASKIETIFKYKGGFERKTSPYSTYDLAENLDFQTCVYCNRIYTKTVRNPSKITRPEFDHWFPKGTYPLLALSFYNLIPSCHVCNSSVKGSTVMNLNNYIHPYVDKSINMSFSYRLKKYSKYEFQIIRPLNSKEDNTIKAFKLEEIYLAHEDEIKDLLKIKKLYSIDYIIKLKKLINQVDKNTSTKEIYRLAFGTHINESDFHKRPLSKMKKDILKELNII